MRDHIDRAAEIIYVEVFGLPDYSPDAVDDHNRHSYRGDCECNASDRADARHAAQALDTAGLLAALEHDAEVRADERAKVLAGFTEEWGVDLTTRPGKPNLGPPRPTTETVARKEHAVHQAWFDEGDAAWCAAYEKSTLVRRLVGPWEPTP